MNIINTQCKLCLKYKKLSKSHIIPEFFYEPLKDTDKNQILVISNNQKERKNKVIQTGTWEYLLCSDCENLINEHYEKPFVQFFRELWTIKDIEPKKILKLEVDYTGFKLLQMSILWRAQVSSHENFKIVNFNSKHAEKLRSFILNQNPGVYYEYGCLMIMQLDKGNVYNIAFQTPWTNNIKGNKIYSFLFGGFVWSFVVASDYSNSPWKKYFINKHNELLVPTINHWEQKIFQNFAYKIADQGKVKVANDFFKNKGSQ